eukprot:g44558.t1
MRKWLKCCTVEDTTNLPIIDEKEALAGQVLGTIVITNEVVLGKLMELKVDKSPGLDGMHPRELKEMTGEETERLIGQMQHGFMKGRSYLTNLLEFFEDIMSMVDNGELVDVMYLDFQKAFDKVPYKKLPHDLELGTKCSVLKFTGDTKMSDRAKCAENTESVEGYRQV